MYSGACYSHIWLNSDENKGESKPEEKPATTHPPRRDLRDRSALLRSSYVSQQANLCSSSTTAPLVFPRCTGRCARLSSQSNSVTSSQSATNHHRTKPCFCHKVIDTTTRIYFLAHFSCWVCVFILLWFLHALCDLSITTNILILSLLCCSTFLIVVTAAKLCDLYLPTTRLTDFLLLANF